MSAEQEILRTLVGSVETDQDLFIAESIKHTASAIVNEAAKVKKGQKVLIWFDTPGIKLVKDIVLKCDEVGADVKFFRRDYECDANLLKYLDEYEIKHMFDNEAGLMDWAENVILIRNPKDPEAMGKAPKDKVGLYMKRYGEVHQRRVTGDVDWTLFLWPTEYEAKKEGLSHKEYFRQVMEACNQPWSEIKNTQTLLKKILDKGSMLVLHANEDDSDPMKRTHVSMSIEGMTFCNSTIDKNYPGSEIFSAPQRLSVNGQVYAEGEHLEDGYLMKDITLIIKDGRIVKAHAEEGDEGLQAILDRDDKEEGFGSRFFGEVALGTNPGLTRRFFNPLLNEKVGGSFHMAIGHCYTLTDYDGEPVKVNNYNTEAKTSLHWDLTILMHRKENGLGGGRVVVDGRLIQQDGKLLDPQLKLLNPNI